MHYKLLALSFAVAAVGCGSDSTNDPGGPVMLMRIMVQDAQPFGVRGAAMDLLDTPGSPLSTATPCDANHQCVVDYLLQHVSPNVACTAAGSCTDPLAAGDAPLTPPETGRQGEAGGTQLRLVFNKLLSSTIKPSDVLVVVDAAGTPVPGTALWDPSGSATVSSDPILIPYGPALVFKPNAPFNAHAQYTIQVNASLVTDRSGNRMADQNGVVVGGTYTKAFTTEALTLLPQTTVSNVTKPGLTVTPDEILQLGFNAPAASSTACTASRGGVPVLVKAYADAGADTASCAAADATLLDIVAVDATGAPTDWAAGDYTISCTVDAAGGGGSTTVSGTFTVGGAAAQGDPQSRTRHVVCP
ncbi:MAG: Ig-like domain-containing protein [Myxococcales bacterium]|nr:Ig-like domain-containing protein [Myxococcales bacterium]